MPESARSRCRMFGLMTPSARSTGERAAGDLAERATVQGRSDRLRCLRSGTLVDVDRDVVASTASKPLTARSAVFGSLKTVGQVAPRAGRPELSALLVLRRRSLIRRWSMTDCSTPNLTTILSG